MRLNRQQTLIAIGTFLLGIITTYIGIQFFGGEWKPSGDGVTIVNTRTGELRYTRTGKRVKAPEAIAETTEPWDQDPIVEPVNKETEWDEFSEEVLTDDEVFAAEEKSFRDRYDSIKKEWDESSTITHRGSTISDLEIYTRQHDLNAEIAVIEEWSSYLESRNTKIFEHLKEFAAKHPDIFLGFYLTNGAPGPQWERATRPLRLQTKLTEEQRTNLLIAFGRASGLEKYSNNEEFGEAIQKLKEYDPSAVGWSLQELEDASH